MSRLLTAQDRTAAARELRSHTLKINCQARILTVFDQISQTNLAAAFAAGRMTEDDADAYNDLLDWIKSMRLKCRALINEGFPTAVEVGDAWPTARSSADALLQTY